MKNQQKTNKTIDSYFLNLINESVKATLQRKAIQEKEKQAALSKSSSEKNDKNDKKEKNNEADKIKKDEISIDNVVEKINSIRSGKSFKDETVLAAFKKYFEGLKDTEKTALISFLEGISKIVTGEFSDDKIDDPSDAPNNIEMKKTNDIQKKSIKPNVIKAPNIEKEKKKSAEDTSGPVPITPKKK